MWAAVLWGIRAKAGAQDTDRIAFESLFLLARPQSTFEDALNALLRWMRPVRGERGDVQQSRRDDPGGVGEADSRTLGGASAWTGGSATS